MCGWIKIHRKIWEWPWSKDPDYLSVWVYLLTNATHKEKDVLFAGKRKKLSTGMLITGRDLIAEKTGVSSSKVQRILKTLESEQQIEQQTSNKNRLITITCWSKYQDGEQQSEHQLNINRTTTEHQLNTNKNVKNVKNEKKKNNAPALGFDEFWEAYPVKTNKKKSAELWDKLRPDEELRKKILFEIDRQKREKYTLKSIGEFAANWRNPTTWLRNRGWEDLPDHRLPKASQTPPDIPRAPLESPPSNGKVNRQGLARVKETMSSALNKSAREGLGLSSKKEQKEDVFDDFGEDFF